MGISAISRPQVGSLFKKLCVHFKKFIFGERKGDGGGVEEERNMNVSRSSCMPLTRD